MLNARPIRKYGENPRFADQALVLSFGDLRFCYLKSGYARRVSIFPRTSENKRRREFFRANEYPSPS